MSSTTEGSNKKQDQVLAGKKDRIEPGQEYMDKLKRNSWAAMIKVRTRILPTRENYKEMICRWCQAVNERQHIIEECLKMHMVTKGNLN